MAAAQLRYHPLRQRHRGKFGYHPSYLSTLFKRYSGYTITQYLNRQRIQVAKRFLTTMPQLPLSEISALVGIPDEKYFMRLFKHYEGVTGTMYRNTFPGAKKTAYEGTEQTAFMLWRYAAKRLIKV